MNDRENNPYAVSEAVLQNSPRGVEIGVREIVGGWEKLRIFYNAALLLPGIGIVGLCVVHGFPLIIMLFGAVAVAIAANVCYFLGPLAELYWRFFFPHGEVKLLRRVCFGLGLFFSLGLFGLVAIGFSGFAFIPDQG